MQLLYPMRVFPFPVLHAQTIDWARDLLAALLPSSIQARVG
jgi:hypothetical protein